MSAAPVAAPETPFKGLAPFEDSPLDALLFFGREREIEVVVANLMANRLTVLYGPSGVGKTSLLRAGVAQRLRHDAQAVVAVFSSWAGDSVADLLDAVERVAGGPLWRTGSLADALGMLARKLDKDVYLVLDQLEEYFLYHEGESGPGTLIDELPETLRRGGLRANFLLGVREDALAQLDAFKSRIPNLFAHRLRLNRLDRRAGEAAIRGPIARYNASRPPEQQVELEPELVDTVLSQVAAGRVDLGRSGRGVVDDEPDADRIEAPYLQLVLERLWEVELARRSRRLRVATLDELGGAARIVEDHLERAMSELSPDEKDAAAAMYNHLVTPSGTKIAHRAGDLAGYAAVDEAAASRVLGRLVQERIVRAGENGAAGPRYEIFHDVLADAVLAWRARHEAERRLEAERAAAARRQRRMLAFAVAAVIAVAVLAGISVYALVQRSNARSQARHAHARELAALASQKLTDDPERSLRLALQAHDVEPSRETENVLRTSLRNLRAQALLPGGGPVAGADFSPDGKLVVTADGAGEARIFRADTGLRVRTLRHGAPLAAATFSPEGSLVVTAGKDGAARIWDRGTGERLHALEHGGPATSATFSPDGSLLATTSADRTARIWEVASGRLLQTLKHPHAVKSAAFSADGALLVTVVDDAAKDRVARVFDVRTGRLVQRLVQPEHERVTSARFAPSGDLVVTGSGHDAARVWNARTGKLRLKLVGHDSAVLDAAFSPTGDRIVTASSDQTARVWNARTGAPVSVLANHRNSVVRARFSPDGNSVVTASADRRATVFDVASGLVLATLVGHRDSVVDAVFAPDGTTVVSASRDGTARVWDALSQPPLRLLGRHRGTIASLAFSADGELVATAGEDRAVRVWRYGAGLVHAFKTGAAAAKVLFSRDGSLLAAASADGTARIWRTAGWSAVQTFRHPDPVAAADLSPDGRLLATADTRGVVRLWSTSTGALRWALPARGAIAAVVFSPGGGTLVTAGADGIARVWRVQEGALERELRGHHRRIVTAAFSPDGRRLVTAGADATARIWDVATGALEHTLAGHGAALTSAAFSPDGRLVVTTSLDTESRVWVAATGRQRWPPLRQAGAINGAAFSADSRWLVTAGPSAGVWDLSTGSSLYLLHPRENYRVMTGVAFSPYGWHIAVAVADGTVRTYDCRLCGRVQQLVALAQTRLERLRVDRRATSSRR
ncbi:MAG TPA: hypothetical protein VGJ58_04095 [Gaiellaceae bacterium]